MTQRWRKGGPRRGAPGPRTLDEPFQQQDAAKTMIYLTKERMCTPADREATRCIAEGGCL